METVTGVTVRGYKAGVHIRTFDVPFLGSYDRRQVSDVSDIDEMSVQFFIRANSFPVYSSSTPLNLSLGYNRDSFDCCDCSEEPSSEDDDDEEEEEETEIGDDSSSDDSEGSENMEVGEKHNNEVTKETV